MKIVLYSGGDSNDLIDESLMSLILKKNPVLTFVPSSSFFADYEFRDFVRHFSSYKVNKFLFFPVDIPCDRILLQEVLKSDVIYLGGGNTFYFLFHLKKQKMLSELRKFAQRGGILCGLSAGAIIMTENIETAGYPSFDRDTNDVNLSNLSSLNLVSFHFFPHFKNSSRYDEAFRSFSLHQKKMIICCPDGSGIIINGGETRFLGKQFVFYQGKKIILNSAS